MKNKAENLEVLELLEEIEDMLENQASVPLTGKIMLRRADLVDIISSIHSKLPEEYQQVKWTYENIEKVESDAEREAEQLVNGAKAKAKEILNDAKAERRQIMESIDKEKKTLQKNLAEERERLINKSEIVKKAKLRAEEIINDAKRKSNEMRKSSFNYSEDILVDVKDKLIREVKVLEKNIQELNRSK